MKRRVSSGIGRLLRTLPVAVAVLLSACGGGGDTGDRSSADEACGGDVPCVGFGTGVAETPVSVVRGDPAAGREACIEQPRTATSDLGVTLKLAADTCLGTPDGTPLADDFVVGVDDGGGPASQQVEQAFTGVVRVWAGSAATPETVAFDPPATLEVELYGARRDGVWASYLILDGDRFAAAPPAGPGDDMRTAVFLGAIAPVADGPETIPLLNTGIVGFVFVPSERTVRTGGAVQAASHQEETTVSAQLPETSRLAFPNVCHWSVIVPDTGHILMVGIPPDPMLPGDTHTASIDGRSYTAELTPQGEFRVSSAYHNRVLLEVALCIDDPTSGERLTLEAQGGSEREADRAGPYDGAIVLQLGGTNPEEAVSLAARLPAMVPAPARTRIVRLQTWSRGFSLVAVVFAYPQSHRELVRFFPGDWRYNFENRRLAGDVDAQLGEPQLLLSVEAGQFNCGTDPCFARNQLQAPEGPLAESATFNCSNVAAVLDYGFFSIDAASGCLAGGGSAVGGGYWTDQVVIEPGDPALDGTPVTLGVLLEAIGSAAPQVCRSAPALSAYYSGQVQIGNEALAFNYDYPNSTVELPRVIEAPVVLGRPFQLLVQFTAVASAIDCNDGGGRFEGSQAVRITWRGIESITTTDGAKVTDFFVRAASGFDWRQSWTAQ